MNSPPTAQGLASLRSELSGLACATTYYVRAYASNEVGTSYGDQVKFTRSACPIYPHC